VLSSPIDKNVLEGVEKSTGNSIAEGALAAAPGLMDIASNVITNKEPMNSKERTANAMNMTMKGASTGATIGGPWGAAIGGVAGLGIGLIQGIGDEKKILKKENLERINYLNDVKDKRKKAQLLSEGKEEVEKSKNLLTAQMGMIGSKYSQS